MQRAFMIMAAAGALVVCVAQAASASSIGTVRPASAHAGGV